MLFSGELTESSSLYLIRLYDSTHNSVNRMIEETDAQERERYRDILVVTESNHAWISLSRGLIGRLRILCIKKYVKVS